MSRLWLEPLDTIGRVPFHAFSILTVSSMSSLRTQVADWLGGADSSNDSEDLVKECMISPKLRPKAQGQRVL